MTRPPLTALLLSDRKPGHYRQAEGVIAAIARLSPVNTARCEIRRRRLIPSRALQQLVNIGVSPATILRLGYGVRASDLPAADLVVSAGGETLAAKLLGASNVFCGRLRRLSPEHIRIAIVNPDMPLSAPNQLASLAPSPIDVPRKGGAPRFGRSNAPRRVGVLVGGNSGHFTYSNEEWTSLGAFLREANASHGVSWIVTTSRRSGGFVADVLAAMAADPSSGLFKFIDFRVAGPGTIADIFGEADAILCTDDSTAMVSEAIGARLPVVALRPQACSTEPREAALRHYLTHQDWYRALPLAELTPGAFLQCLEEISPRTTSQLDELAAGLKKRLPELFAKD